MSTTPKFCPRMASIFLGGNVPPMQSSPASTPMAHHLPAVLGHNRPAALANDRSPSIREWDPGTPGPQATYQSSHPASGGGSREPQARRPLIEQVTQHPGVGPGNHRPAGLLSNRSPSIQGWVPGTPSPQATYQSSQPSIREWVPGTTGPQVTYDTGRGGRDQGPRRQWAINCTMHPAPGKGGSTGRETLPSPANMQGGYHSTKGD